VRFPPGDRHRVWQRCGKVREILLAAAREHPAALREPGAGRFLRCFGDNALNFELGVWSAEMSSRPRRFRSDLNFAIERKLRAAGIEIPFPQRDVHVASLPPGFAIHEPRIGGIVKTQSIRSALPQVSRSSTGKHLQYFPRRTAHGCCYGKVEIFLSLAHEYAPQSTSLLFRNRTGAATHLAATCLLLLLGAAKGFAENPWTSSPLGWSSSSTGVARVGWSSWETTKGGTFGGPSISVETPRHRRESSHSTAPAASFHSTAPAASFHSTTPAAITMPPSIR